MAHDLARRMESEARIEQHRQVQENEMAAARLAVRRFTHQWSLNY